VTKPNQRNNRQAEERLANVLELIVLGAPHSF
jgi:hypothetical protein